MVALPLEINQASEENKLANACSGYFDKHLAACVNSYHLARQEAYDNIKALRKKLKTLVGKARQQAKAEVRRYIRLIRVDKTLASIPAENLQLLDVETINKLLGKKFKDIRKTLETQQLSYGEVAVWMKEITDALKKPPKKPDSEVEWKGLPGKEYLQLQILDVDVAKDVKESHGDLTDTLNAFQQERGIPKTKLPMSMYFKCVLEALSIAGREAYESILGLVTVPETVEEPATEPVETVETVEEPTAEEVEYDATIKAVAEEVDQIPEVVSEFAEGDRITVVESLAHFNKTGTVVSDCGGNKFLVTLDAEGEGKYAFSGHQLTALVVDEQVEYIAPTTVTPEIKGVNFRVGDRIQCYPDYDYALKGWDVKALVLAIETNNEGWFMGATVEWHSKKKGVQKTYIPGGSLEWILRKL